MKNEIAYNYNTDNKRHLYVTVFELPTFYIMTLISHHPDTSPVLAIKLLYHDAKNRAIASLPAGRQACTLTQYWLILSTRDCPDASSANTNALYCRVVSAHLRPQLEAVTT